MKDPINNAPRNISDEDKLSTGVRASSESTSSSELPWSSEETSSDSEFEEFDANLEYINQKQQLLSRASAIFNGEDSYNAIHAIHDQTMPPPLSTIWAEAKEYLCTNKRAKRGSKLRSFPKKPCKSPRDPRIDLSRVNQSSAAIFDDTGNTKSALPLAVTHLERLQGEWMAQALSKSSRTNRWRVVSDLQTCSLGLAPPEDASFSATVSLEEATDFSTRPQIVTQASPPFCVVHVNKAFLTKYGTTEIIGKPIENLFQLVDDTDEMYQIGNIFGNRSCRLKVTPVVDRSRKRQRLSISFMSHILVEFEDARTIAVIETSNETSNENSMFGTVG